MYPGLILRGLVREERCELFDLFWRDQSGFGVEGSFSGQQAADSCGYVWFQAEILSLSVRFLSVSDQ